MEILLIDDNELIQQVMARYLGSLGYNVSIAATAAEAVTMARRSAPALLIIDMHLPDKDGPDVLDDLRQLPGCAQVPAIGISGLTEADAPAAASLFSEYLTKPVDLDVLEVTVRTYLKGP